jgi:hypothetical protein
VKKKETKPKKKVKKVQKKEKKPKSERTRTWYELRNRATVRSCKLRNRLQIAGMAGAKDEKHFWGGSSSSV